MWGESEVKEKMREMKWKKGFKHSNPDFYGSWAVLVFLQNYGFATTLSNLISMTTLRFFDVPDSFGMLV